MQITEVKPVSQLKKKRKGDSISLIIRKMLHKTTLQYNFALLRVAVINRPNNS